MEIFYSVVRFFTAGGVFMLPILATVIVFQLWYLRRQGVR